MDKQEQTLVLIKPDAMHKGIMGEVISALDETGLNLVGAKMVKVSEELAKDHYFDLAERTSQEIFENVVNFLQGKFHKANLLALVYQGENAISIVREKAGATHPEKADPSSIRGKFGRIHTETGNFENVLHCSDSKENAEREVSLWFKPEELVSVE